MELPNPNFKPEWLKELQLKSWEPEILLSGIVLYGMFQVPEALDRFLFYFSSQIYNDFNAMNLLVAMLKVGVYWLIVGLVLHLICRGLWIGVVGLSYSFPKGVNPEKLKFRPRYMKKVEAVPSLDVIILRLEKVSSFLYSVSFFLFMSLVGTYIFLTVLVIIPFLLILPNVDVSNQEMVENLNNYSNGILYLGLLGVFDFLTLGYFRRFKVFAVVFWPFYTLFSYLSLARYYRHTYFTIITNLNNWWLFGFLLVYIFLSYIGIASIQNGTPGGFFSRIEVWSDVNGDLAFEGFYQDRFESQPSLMAQIPSDIIDKNVLRVFLPSRIDLQDSLKKFMDYDSIVMITDESFDEGQYLLKQLSGFYRLSIADSLFNTKMYFQNVSATSQRGYFTYLNISYLEEGLHELKVEGPEKMFEQPFAIVPFYKVE